MSMYFTKLFKNSIYKLTIQKQHSDFSLIVSKAEITVRFYLEVSFCPASFIGDFGKLRT